MMPSGQSPIPLRSADARLLEILYRLWEELARDLADWIIRAESLEAKAWGAQCLEAAARRTGDYERLMRACALDPWRAPALPPNYSQLLVEMSEAPSAELYFASIALFWDPALMEAAREWGEGAGFAGAADASVLLAPAMDPSAAQRFIEAHLPGPEGRVKAHGWASHLADCLSAAGGFYPAPSGAGDALISDYRLNERIDFFLDPRFTRSEGREGDSAQLLEAVLRAPADSAACAAWLRAWAACLVARAEMAALAVFENWRTHLSADEPWENDAARNEFRQRMIQAARAGLSGFAAARQAMEAADQLDPAPPGERPQTPIPMAEYRKFRSLSARQRLSDLEMGPQDELSAQIAVLRRQEDLLPAPLRAIIV